MIERLLLSIAITVALSLCVEYRVDRTSPVAHLPVIPEKTASQLQ